MAKPKTVNWLTERYLYALAGCWAVDRVERQQGPVKFDCFGFADYVGVSDTDTLWVQATSLANLSSRTKKVQENPAAIKLVNKGDSVLVFGWKYLEGGIYLLRRYRLTKSLSYLVDDMRIGLEDLTTG